MTINKDQRYDRQIRLWGEDGQIRLEEANLCVLNSGPVATEFLKNLVLPGIGSFTIIDNKKVTQRDLGNNFFVEKSSIGKSRAQETTRLLYSHNDFVKGAEGIEADPVKIIEESIESLNKYTIIIATELPESSVKKLAVYCRTKDKPLVIVRANGLLGYIRVIANEHKIIETKQEYPPTDLRLSDPFPELISFTESIDLSKLDSQLHSHVPYPVLLLKAARLWGEKHNKPPSKRVEEDEFKKLIRSMMLNPDEENFAEAINRAYLSYNRYSIPDEVQVILDDEKSKNLVNDPFWVIANAVRKFVLGEGNGKLPVLGTVPDMHSDTESFIKLQEIYVHKATQDFEHVKAYVVKNLEQLGKSPNVISDAEIKLFCKNCMSLKLIRYRSLEDELERPIVGNLEEKMMDFMQVEPEPGNGVWYVLMRAAERFHTEFKRYPGERKDYAEDYFELKKHTENILKEFSMEPNRIQDEYLFELCRFGNAQIHSIAAFIGGVAAQEVIKLITKKWVPLNNTYVYNGIKASSCSMEM